MTARRLLYFSPVHWHSYDQRPHYMIRYFLASHPENKVLWVNPYPTRFPCWQDISRLVSSRFCKNSGSHKGDSVEVIFPKALPLEPLINSEHINYLLYWRQHWEKFEDFADGNTILGIGRPSKLALMALERIKYISSFYDAMDDFPEFYTGFSRNSMVEIEQKIVNKIEKIFVSSSYLAAKFPKAIKILNGYAMDSLPPVMPRVHHNPLVFGFIGTLGQWFDWSVMITLAKQFPEAVIRLIGPMYTKYTSTLPANIEIYPECTQTEAINYISQFDIGLIPFKQNALTQGVDPIKYYEYRAMGLPVLSTRFGEMLKRENQEGVYFFENNNIDNIKKLFLYQDATEKIMLFRKNNDWSTRFSHCGFFA